MTIAVVSATARQARPVSPAVARFDRIYTEGGREFLVAEHRPRNGALVVIALDDLEAHFVEAPRGAIGACSCDEPAPCKHQLAAGAWITGRQPGAIEEARQLLLAATADADAGNQVTAERKALIATALLRPHVAHWEAAQTLLSTAALLLNEIPPYAAHIPAAA